jgi:glycine cleavage system H protein
VVPLIALTIILTFLTLDYVVERAAQMRVAAAHRAAAAVPVRAPVPVESPMGELPPGLFVGPGHVWVRLAADGSVRVGADRLLLSLLGGLDAAYTLPEGASVREQGPLMMLRRGDRALKVRSPLEGRVTAVNPRVAEAPESVARDPFGEWIYELQPAPESQGVRGLPTGDEARSWMSREVGRLRERLSELLGGGALGEATMADGGAPSEAFAEHLGDREWEELLSSFFGQHEA